MAEDTDDFFDGDAAERAQPVAVGPPRRRMDRTTRARAVRNRRRRRTVGLLSLGLLVVVVVAAVLLGSKLWDGMFGSPVDFTGSGNRDVVIQVHDGDSTTAIAQTLVDAHVVATLSRSSPRHRATRRSRRSSPVSTSCAPRYRPRRPSSGSPTRRTGSAS